MQGCANDFGKLIGKVAVLRMAFGCPDAVPALSEWKRLGAMTTKGFDYSMNTVNSEADDSKGLVENLVNNMDFTISGDGEFRKADKSVEVGAMRMSKYIFDEVQAGRQPTVWVRFDFAGEDAGTYIMGYFNTTSWSGDFGTSDISTFSGEWKVYDADTVVFEVANSIAATGVTVTPATASLVVGATQQLGAMVEPNDATNKSVTWESSDPAIATVSPTGLVTIIAEEGSATITATTADGGFTDTCEVTVTEAP
ncbi:Ig-like domain-containing protein [Cedecea colo]|uniref:Ig domain-containing protein n=1 Tax=Cedecea colo TaxID=2552946 RepID=A0ABX0VL11_9ENTR|nr:Ig-like domain-containing protein [Cedecea colo]NIY47265.1 Ig domain-containing protein [Cedecea colo]